MSLVKAHRLDLNKVSFVAKKNDDGSLIPNPKGGKAVYINYDSNLFYMQTPVMSMPYDMSCYDGDYKKYSINLAFRDLDSDARIRGFHENITTLQEMIIKEANQESKSWFGKKHKSVDVTSALCKDLLKKSIDKGTGEPDGKYPDTINLKLPVRDGKPQFKITDFQDQPIENPDLETIFTKESKVQAIVRCGGIWIVGVNFGCTWSVDQIRVESQSPSEGNKISFIQDDSEGEEEEEVDDTSDEDTDSD
jgi:hypothetical protein